MKVIAPIPFPGDNKTPSPIDIWKFIFDKK